VYADDAHTTPAHGRTYKNTTRCESLDTYDSEPDHQSAALTVDAHTTVDGDASTIVRGV
jgi:hypothetical protein